MRNAANDDRLAHIRIRSLFFPGMKNRTANAARGEKRMMLSKCWSIGSTGDVIPQERYRPNYHKQRVSLYTPGLQNARRVGKHFHEERSRSHRAIDDPGVPPDGERRTEPRQPAGAIYAAIHYSA